MPLSRAEQVKQFAKAGGVTGAAFTITVAVVQAWTFVMVYGAVCLGLDGLIIGAIDKVAVLFSYEQGHFAKALAEKSQAAQTGSRLAMASSLFCVLPSVVWNVPLYISGTTWLSTRPWFHRLVSRKHVKKH